MRRAFFALALANLAVVAWAFHDELVTRRPWKAIQAGFNELLAARGQPPVRIGLREVTNPELGLHDRCQSCHLAIERDGFGDEAPPHLRSHPRRTELLGPHPPERFGCTPCHQGEGPQTKGIAGARFDHGRDDPGWELPLLSGAHTQASCLDCHDVPPAGADVLARGAQLFEDLQCGGCHAAGKLAPPQGPTAPTLERIGEKMSPAFLVAWLRDPRALRPGTRMPDFGLSGADARDIAAFLTSAAPSRPLPAAAIADDPAQIAEGRALFDSAGCRGCHLLSATETFDGAPPPREARFGPSLDGTGDKASAAWLATWLAGPRDVWPGARMPSLRLAPSQIPPLVAFLGSLRVPEGALRADAEPAAPPDAARGKELVLRLGCAGCHAVPGIAREGRPGPDLDGFGDRLPEEISFGDARVDCGARPELLCFAEEKLRTPRRLVGRAVPELLMPDQHLAPDEIEALSVYLLANRSRPVPEAYRRPATDLERAGWEGERELARRNCGGCHEGASAAGAGGWVRRFHAEPALAPPSLAGAGRKLQVSWLWAFLAEPRTLRPFLAARMPAYGLDAGAIDRLSRWLVVRDGEPYPVQPAAAAALAAEDAAPARALFELLRCRQCHPASGAPAGTDRAPAELAPDLAMAPERLKSAWVRKLIADPQRVLPGTRMPSFFVPLDEERPEVLSAVPGYFGDDAARQIDALAGVVGGR